MLGKMKRRVVLLAMVIFAAAVAAVVFAVNIWNFTITGNRQDAILEGIIEKYERADQETNPTDYRMPGPFGERSPESSYMNRFFIVEIDKEGEVIRINREQIATVSEDDAQIFARKVLGKKAVGYTDEYRYRMEQSAAGTVIGFLNCEREIQQMKTLALVSGVIAAAGLMVVFILLTVFAGRVINPFVKNIEIQKRFITDAGHELKTPLTSISASAEILAMEQEDNEWVKNIQTQSARMSRLITGLVRLSRLDEEQPFAEKSDFSLSDAVWETAEAAAAAATARGKSFSAEIEDNVMYRGDKSTIQQMISALLENAVKYSDDNGIIRLAMKKHRRRIEITVYNTIPENAAIDTKRIFDRFYRSDGSRWDKDSFGIGLSAARAAAERHKGTVTAERISSSEIVFKALL